MCIVCIYFCIKWNVGIGTNKEFPIDLFLILLWTFLAIVLSHFSLCNFSCPSFSQPTSKVNVKVHALSGEKRCWSDLVSPWAGVGVRNLFIVSTSLFWQCHLIKKIASIFWSIFFLSISYAGKHPQSLFLVIVLKPNWFIFLWLCCPSPLV